METAVQAVRLITLAAAMKLAGAVEDEAEETVENYELKAMMILYTMGVIGVVLMVQWGVKAGRSYWEREDREDPETSEEDHPPPLVPAESKEEENESSEDVREKIRKQEENELRGRVQKMKEDEIQKERSNQAASSSGFTPQPSKKQEDTQETSVVMKGQDEKRGEKSTSSRLNEAGRVVDPLNDEKPKSDRHTRKFMMTRTGSVYHVDWECGYLTAFKTGMAKRLVICSWCDENVPYQGHQPIFSGTFHDEIHLTAQCPMKRNEKKTTCCAQCHARRSG
eukprot:Skav202135  [mRNA]  locus=scaffold3391:23140:23979:- [translate_table: standard]